MSNNNNNNTTTTIELKCCLCQFRIYKIKNKLQELDSLKELQQYEFIPCTTHTSQFNLTDNEFTNEFICLKEFERKILRLPESITDGIGRTLFDLALYITQGANTEVYSKQSYYYDEYPSDMLYGKTSIDIRHFIMKVYRVQFKQQQEEYRKELFPGRVSSVTMINISLIHRFLDRKYTEIDYYQLTNLHDDDDDDNLASLFGYSDKKEDNERFLVILGDHHTTYDYYGNVKKNQIPNTSSTLDSKSKQGNKEEEDGEVNNIIFYPPVKRKDKCKVLVALQDNLTNKRKLNDDVCQHNNDDNFKNQLICNLCGQVNFIGIQAVMLMYKENNNKNDNEDLIKIKKHKSLHLENIENNDLRSGEIS
jgi:hypothetical protein